MEVGDGSGLICGTPANKVGPTDLDELNSVVVFSLTAIVVLDQGLVRQLFQSRHLMS